MAFPNSRTVVIPEPHGGALQDDRDADKQFREYGNMAKATTYLVLMLLITGCSTGRLDESSTELDIGNVHIDATSKRSDGSVEMINRCSGFILSEKEVRNFLANASRIKNDAPDKYSRILPCSATGTAVINKRKYNWVIRAGGIGEFSSGKDQFMAICGKNCCDKVPGIC